jgi:hypothetical protein
MLQAKQTLDRYFPEMRWRCLSLAADLDRVQRCQGGGDALQNDPRVQTLQQALRVLLSTTNNRAEQVLMLFSDTSPPPSR